MQSDHRRAFSLVELLVAMAVVGLLVALFLPAADAAREKARRRQCADNLKRIGRATLAYADANKGFLPATANNSTEGVSGFTRLLPYLDHTDVWDAYEFDVDWRNPANAGAVARRIPVAECPSAPHFGRLITIDEAANYRAGGRDYYTLVISGAVRGLFPEGFDRSGAFPGIHQQATLSEVVDGLSNTGFWFEEADNPYHWRAGKLIAPQPTGLHGIWSNTSMNSYRGYSRDGLAEPGPCAMNCNNQTSVYAFHPGGAHVAMGDGAVKFVRESIDVYVMYSIVSRAGGEVLARGDF